MPSENIVEWNPGSWQRWSNRQNEYPYSWIPLSVIETGAKAYVTSTKSTTSVNSPRQWMKIKVYGPPRPHKGRPVTRPREPSYFKPPPPLLRARRPNQSNRSWEAALRKHDQRWSAYRAKVKRLEDRRDARMSKYKIRLAKYEAYLLKMSKTPLISKRIRTVNNSQWNPYSSVSTHNSGIQGSHDGYYRMWKYWVPDPVMILSYRGDLTQIYESAVRGLNRNKPLALIDQLSLRADSIAKNRYHEKLTGELAHIGQVIAERVQTIGLLAESVKRLSDFLRNASVKGWFKTLRKSIRTYSKHDAANDLLAFKFGVEPLISDVSGTAEVLAHLMTDNLRLATVSARGSATVKEEIVEQFVPNDNSDLTGFTVTIKTTVEIRRGYVCEYALDNLAVRELAQVGLLNPAELLWELVPWSFIFDWVYDIGRYLRDVTADAGLTFSRGTMSTRITWRVDIEAIRVIADANQPQYWNEETWGYRHFRTSYGGVEKERILLTQPISVHAPEFKNPLSFNHVLESIALLTQTVKFK